MGQEQVTKVYQLRSEGAGTVVEDLTSINKAYVEIINTRQALSRQRISIEDPKQLADLDKQLTNLTQKEGQLVTQMKEKQSVAKERAISNSKELKDNQALEGSYDQLKKKYTDLLAIAKGAIPLTDPKQVREAATELQNLKAQLDAFDQALKRTAVSQKELQLEIIQTNDVASGRSGSSTALSDEELARHEKLLAIQTEEALAQDKSTEATAANTAAKATNARVTAEEAAAEDIHVASINQYRQYVKELTAERNELNLLTAQGTIRQKEINEEIDQYNKLIRQNVDAYQQQKINIGNYPTLKAELSAVRQEMERLVIAGEADTAAFKQLSDRARQLNADLNQVKVATEQTAASQAKLVQVAGKSFSVIRQLAYILPGLGIAGILNIGVDAVVNLYKWATGADLAAKAVEKLKEEMKELDELQKSIATSEADQVGRLTTLYARTQDVTKSQAQRLNAVKELQKEYPEYFGNLSKEAILAGDAARAYEDLATALFAKGRAEAFQKKYNETLSAELDLEEKITALQAKKAKLNTSTISRDNKGNIVSIRVGDNQDDIAAANIDAQIKELDAKQRELVSKRVAYADEIGKNDIFNEKTHKERLTRMHDFTAQELAADRFNIEQKARLREQDYRIDSEQQEFVFQDVKQNLDKRLEAYLNYANDLKLIITTQKNGEIEAARVTLAEINKIKGIEAGGGKITPAQKKLLDQEEGYRDQVQRLEKELAAALLKIDVDSARERVAIVKSDIAERLRGIEEIKAKAAADSNEQLLILQDQYDHGAISFKKYKEEEKRLADEAHIHQLNLIKEYLKVQIAAYDAASRDATALKDALAKIDTELIAATNKLYDDTKKKTFDLQDFYKKLKNTAIDAAAEIANGYIAQQQRQIDKENELAQTRLDHDKEARLNAATSAAEKAAIEKEFDQKQEVLERQKFERQKKQAEAQLEVEFAVASIKAMSAGFETGGIYGALAAEALVALEYATKLAVLESAHYGSGGSLDKVLGYGGIFDGPSHGRGGIKFLFGGMPREVEGREGFVINKNSMATGKPFTVTGTPAQIASAANIVGGGVNFAPGASIQSFAYGGSLGMGLSAPVFMPSSSGNDDRFWAVMGMMQNIADGMHSRIDNLTVSIDPNLVQRANDKRRKTVKIGEL